MNEIKKPLLRIDWRLTHAIRSVARFRVISILFGLFAHAGDSMVVIPALIIWWILYGITDFEHFLPMWLSLLIASVVTVILKFAFRRNRPTGGKSRFHRKADPFSFPSGHAVRCFNIATCVMIAYSPEVGAILWVWAMAVTSGRIVQGIHYVSDVIAGAAVGVLIALVVSTLAVTGVF